MENNVITFPQAAAPEDKVLSWSAMGDAVYWTPKRIRGGFGPSMKLLPFVTMKNNDPIVNAESYWNDVPTGDGHADFKRGKQYADLTIKAMVQDGCGRIYLEHIFKAMIDDAVARRAKGGKYSRTPIPPAVGGFLCRLSEHVAEFTKSKEALIRAYSALHPADRGRLR